VDDAESFLRALSTRRLTMQVTSVPANPPAAAPPKPTAAEAPAAAVAPKLTAANVSAAALKAAVGDGDGRTGAAALNDGDAAAQSARRQAFDVKA
jgi:hypothetical protein